MHHVTLRYIIAAGVFHVRYLVVFCFLFLTCLECEDGKREKYLYLVMEWGWRRRGREIWGWANEGVGVYIYGWQLLASLLACLLLRCSRSQPSVLLLRECWGSVWCFGALVLWCFDTLVCFVCACKVQWRCVQLFWDEMWDGS